MRYVGILALMAFLPALWAMLSNGTVRRDHAFAVMGFSLFLGGSVSIDASLISWPLWPGYSRGLIVTLADCFAIALVLTRRRPLGRVPLRGFFAAYAVMLALSITVSAVPVGSLFVLWQFMMVFILYICVAGEADEPRNLRSLYGGLAVGLIMEAGFVINQKAHGVVQAFGTMYHQNTLGMMVELTILPLLAMLLDGDKRKLIWAGVLSGLIVLAGGGSRAGTGLVLVGAILTLIASVSHSITPRKMRVLFIAIAIIGVSVPVGLATLSTRFKGGSMVTDESERRSLENAARSMAEDHPLGVGANMFVTTANMGGYSARAGVGWHESNRAAPVHHAYLLARAETGWHGLAAFVALLIAPIILGLRVVYGNRRVPGSGVAIGSVVAIFMLVLHNFYEWALFSYSCLALFALNMGVIAAMWKRTMAFKADARRRRAAAVSVDTPAEGPAATAMQPRRRAQR